MIKKELYLFIFISLFLIFGENLYGGKDKWTFTGSLPIGVSETISSIAINPIDSSIIYAGNDTSTIFKSTNGGRAWSELTGIKLVIEGTTTNKKIIGIALDPNYPDTLFAASDSGGVYRSYNGGTIWTKIGKPANGLVDTNIATLVLNPKNSQILYVNADSGVYKSLDRGDSWFSVNNGLQDSLNVNYITIDLSNPNILYGGISNGKMYKTENGGNDWSACVGSPLSGTPNITAILVNPKRPNRFYVASQSDGVFYSSNRGVSFTNISFGFPTPYPKITSLAIDTSSTTKVYAGTELRGIYRRLDTDTSWTAVNEGLPGLSPVPVTIIQSLAVNPKKPIDIYAGAQGQGIYVYTGNRDPVIADIPDKRINAGEQLIFDVVAVDPDSGETETLVYSVDTLVAGQTFDHLYDRKFRWTPDTSQAGYDTLVFTVTDQRGGIDRDTVIINVNRNPVLSAIGNQTVNEGDSLTITLSAVDSDGDSVTYSVSTIYPSGATAELPEGATFTSGNIFSWIPGYDIVSKTEISVIYYVTFTASDPLGGSDLETIQIKVTDKNRPPEFIDLPSLKTVSERQALEFEVKAQDLDLDEIEFHTEGLSAMDGAGFDSVSSHVFAWIPTYNDSGSYYIVFILKDARGATARDTVNIRVNDANRPPVITNISDTTFYVHVSDSLAFYIYAADPDDDSLSYNAATLPPGATYKRETTHRFLWIPNYDHAGTYTVKFNVEDGRGGSDVVNITIVADHPPVFEAISDKTISENSILNFTLSATDADNDVLTYSVLSIPDGATASTVGGITFDWQPDYNSSGIYSVRFMVSDGKTGYDTSVVQINVLNVNQAPVFEPITNKAVNIGNRLQFVVNATDLDNESLTFSASNLPSGASFDSLTQLFDWTPSSLQVDTSYYVKFKVEDQSGAADSTTVEIMITDENFAPEFTDIQDKIISENQQLIFAVVANDPNLDTLVYSVLELMPQGAVFDSTASPAPYFKWTPDSTQAGDYVVSFLASDNKGGLDTVAVNISVANDNRNPVIVVPSDTSVIESGTVIFSINVSDPDGDDVTVKYENMPSGADSVLEDGVYKFRWTPSVVQQGVYSVLFIAVDTYGGVDSATTVITVNNYNIAPSDPEIVFPSSGEEMFPESYFVWKKSVDEDVEDTVSYVLEIDDNSNFANPEITASGINPISSLSKNSGLANKLLKTAKSETEESVETVSVRLNELSGYGSLTDNIVYFWRVRAYDQWGGSSSYMVGPDSFVVNIGNDVPESVTKGFSPANSKATLDLKPEISWYPAEDPDISDDAGNLKYWIQISRDNSFTVTIFYQDTTDEGVCSITVADSLEDEVAWFYRIKTIDDENETSNWSEIQKFYTNSINTAPSPFGLIAPLDKASFDPRPEIIVFEWEKSFDTDPLSVVTYTIEISTDSLFSSGSIVYSRKDIPADSTTLNISTSQYPQGSYYWRIISKDNSELVTESNEKWNFSLGIVSAVEDEKYKKEIPDKFSLSQNYPNPFNNETVIRYTLPMMSRVRIKIYNLLGQEIVTLVNAVQGPGRYNIRWNGKDKFGKDVASGIYIYSITSKNYTTSKRLVYLK